MRVSRSVFSILLILTLALLSQNGCDRSESNAQAPQEENQAIPVSVLEVQPVAIRDILVLPGETEAWQDVLVPADISGRVEWIGPKEGESLKKGQLFAKIDVSALKVALEKAECDYKLNEDLLKRREKLFERKSISQEELDRIRTETLLAQHTLEQTRVEYERGFTKSPISGVINYLFVDQGEFIERGHSIATIVNVDKIKINVSVPEMDVRFLKPGQESRVTIDAYPNESMIGVVDFVSYKADPATKTFKVRVLVDNSDGKIRPGMIARLAFIRQVIPNALVAPLFALVDKGGERILFLEKDGVAQSRTVSLGVIDNDRIQILKGLNPGDRLIVKGQTQVEEGMKVHVQ